MNLSKYQYPKQLTEFVINKALSIPLQELRTPKTISNDNNLPFITTYTHLLAESLRKFSFGC